jgi:glycosyltransferase involved in cell wall biosynthesis
MRKRDPQVREGRSSQLQLPPVSRASVIVPAHNAAATLPRTLGALREQHVDGGFEVIVVVDDASGDGTVAAAQAAAGDWATIVHHTALGVVGARNLGVARSSGDALAFCDADVFPSPGWLAAGVDALATADLVQGKVLPDPSAPVGPFDRSLWITRQVGLWETANLFVSRAVFERAGGFERVLSPFHRPFGEDMWFAHRALRAGARPAFCPDALAYHAVIGRGWRSYVGERRRLEYFPALAARMPDLRRQFLYRRVFLTRRSALFDLALLAALAAGSRRSLVPLLGVVPYLQAMRSHSKRAWPVGPRSSLVGAVDVTADLVALLALLGGSVRHRSPVL